MIAAISAKPWLFWSLLAAVAAALLYGVAAYVYGKGKSYPRVVRSSGFNGIVRETAKFTLLGSGAGFVTSILVEELDPFGAFRQATLAVLIISLVASILNYYMSAALDTLMGHDGKSVTLTTPLWAIIHGVIFGLSLTASVILLIAVIKFAISFP